MKMTRREMLLASLGLVSGCSSTSSLSERPRTRWPAPIARPSVAAGVAVPPAPTPTVPRSVSVGGVNALPRARWAKAGPIASRVNPMGSIARITIHHEGWTPVWFSDQASTAARIEQIRNIHVRDRGWGDIGYHYIIDRAGRVWQGRDIRYQGAHVSKNNEHNVGVMCLGNFDKQRPSDAQMQSLINTLRSVQHMYSIPARRVYTHQELSPTACPGSHLQPRVVAIRSNGYLA